MNELYYEDILLWKYIDQWPKIPNDLLLDNINNAADHRLQFANSPGVRVIVDGNKSMLNMQYRRWDVSNELEAWMIENTYQFHEIGVQYFYNEEGRDRFYPHCDKVNRRWVFMYIHETGGENVETFFYQERGHPVVRPHRTMVDDLSLIDPIGSVVAEPHRWIVLNGLVLHDAYPIDTIRKTIVGGLEQENLDFL